MDLKKVQRNTFILTLWTFMYFLWLHWFLFANWNFDIFLGWHWREIFNQWWNGGWVIQGTYYWVFVLTLFFALPIWIMGFCFFASIHYKDIWERVFWDQIYKNKTKKIQQNNSRIRIKKKKSYKEIRPTALSAVRSITKPLEKQAATPDFSFEVGKKDSNETLTEHFSHRELSNDENTNTSPFTNDALTDQSLDDVPFETQMEVQPIKENLSQIIRNSGATVLKNVKVDEKTLQFIGVSDKMLYLVLNDDEIGDWLADEERFNDDDPLWFSESAHRISPITLLKQAEKSIQASLKAEGLNFKSQLILVKTDGNIINAEDMMDTWKEMNVWVARSNLGQPLDLPTFEQTFPKELASVDDADLQKIKSALNVE